MPQGQHHNNVIDCFLVSVFNQLQTTIIITCNLYWTCGCKISPMITETINQSINQSINWINVVKLLRQSTAFWIRRVAGVSVSVFVSLGFALPLLIFLVFFPMLFSHSLWAPALFAMLGGAGSFPQIITYSFVQRAWGGFKPVWPCDNVNFKNQSFLFMSNPSNKQHLKQLMMEYDWQSIANDECHAANESINQSINQSGLIDTSQVTPPHHHLNHWSSYCQNLLGLLHSETLVSPREGIDTLHESQEANALQTCSSSFWAWLRSAQPSQSWINWEVWNEKQISNRSFSSAFSQPGNC